VSKRLDVGGVTRMPSSSQSSGERLWRLLVIFEMSSGQIPGVGYSDAERAVAKQNATLSAKKSGDHSMVRIRLLGHVDMMPELRTAPQA